MAAERWFARAGRRIGLPTIPFFIVAGITFGPHTPGFVVLDNPDTIHLLAMLGLVLLLFHLGTWRNSKIIGPDDPETIRSLKDELDGDLYASGSITLVRAMLDDGLIDGLHLFVYPLTLGSGPRLFPDGAAPRKLALATTESYDNGVVYLAYRPQA